jgi:hypothetical protein
MDPQDVGDYTTAAAARAEASRAEADAPAAPAPGRTATAEPALMWYPPHPSWLDALPSLPWIADATPASSTPAPRIRVIPVQGASTRPTTLRGTPCG